MVTTFEVVAIGSDSTSPSSNRTLEPTETVSRIVTCVSGPGNVRKPLVRVSLLRCHAYDCVTDPVPPCRVMTAVTVKLTGQLLVCGELGLIVSGAIVMLSGPGVGVGGAVGGGVAGVAVGRRVGVGVG